MASKTVLAVILKAIDQSTSVIKKVDSKVVKLGKTAAAVGKKMTVGLTLPLVALAGASLAATSSFETGMSNVSTLIDTTVESMDDMSKKVLEIGQRTPVALEDLTGALFDVRSAGIKSGDALGVLEKSARLGVAGLGSTKQAVDLVTSSINAFGLEGEKANAIYDQVFKATKFGKTTIAELSQGFGAVAGTVAATGTPLDEYLASVAAMTTTGLPASVAHTQLRSVIASLTRSTKKTRKVFRGLGAKDFPDLIKKSGGLVPALEKISGKLGGNTAKILDLVGSTEALNAVLSLTGAQNKTFNDALNDMRDGAEAVGVAFDKQASTTAASSQMMKNSLAAAGVAIGTILQPALAKLVGALQSVAQWIQTLDESTIGWIVTIAAIVAAIGPVLSIVGKLTKAFALLKSAILVLTPAFLAFKAVLLANPLLVVVAAMIAAAGLIIVFWTPISNFFGFLWEGIKSIFRAFNEWLRSIFFAGSFVGALRVLWSPVGAFFSVLWGGITSVFEGAWDVIKGIVEKIGDATDFVVDRATEVKLLVTGSARPEEGLGPDFGRGPRDTVFGSGRSSGSRNGGGAADIIAGRAGAGGAGGTVKVEFANVPAGTRVTQTEGADAIDLQVGRQVALP